MSEFKLGSGLAEYLRKFPNNGGALKTKSLIESQPLCFERTCFDDGHITGSAWIISPDQKQVLLTHHQRLGIWVQLGGHSDGSANTLDVAIREEQEESGIEVHPIRRQILDIDIHRVPSTAVEPTHLHYDIRFALSATNWSYTVSEESFALRWVRFEDLSQLSSDPSLLRMRDKWLQIASRQ